MSSRVQSPPGSSTSATSSRGAAKRLIKELDKWQTEQKEEEGIERLGPVDNDDLFTWEAVVNGRGIGSGYDGKLQELGIGVVTHAFLEKHRV